MQVTEILESLDNNNKNELENQIVEMGANAVPVLVEQLQCSKGLKRGVVAMSLIRIGESSIDSLKAAANKKFISGYSADDRSEPVNKSVEGRKIWVCWLQGMDNAPELVKKCYQL